MKWQVEQTEEESQEFEIVQIFLLFHNITTFDSK